MTDSQKPESESRTASLPSISSASLAQYYREKLENVRLRLPEIARQLKEHGVTCVQIQYDGCGDSGQIESVALLDTEGRDLYGKVPIAEDQLMDVFYDLTQARHPGWENNDGAFGEFEWNLFTDDLEHVHNERFTDYNTTEHSGL